jgi:cupin 2 domain-containing protein
VAGAFLSGDTRRAVTLASIRSGRLQAGLPLVPEADEVFDVLAEGESARVERIVSTGQVTPEGEWYDQVWDEFVLVVSGAARLRIESEKGDRSLEPGDWLLLPAHCRHRVTWSQSDPPTVWLALHCRGLAVNAGKADPAG